MLKSSCQSKLFRPSLGAFAGYRKDLSDVHGGRAAIFCYELMKSFLNFGELGHRQSDFARSDRIAPVRRVGQRNMLAANHWTVLVDRALFLDEEGAGRTMEVGTRKRLRQSRMRGSLLNKLGLNGIKVHRVVATCRAPRTACDIRSHRSGQDLHFPVQGAQLF